MRRILIATTIAAATAGVATAAALAASAPAQTATNPPCTPKIVKIAGRTAAENCGPATATLHISGKTYTFRNGFCEQRKSAGSSLELNLGTTIVGLKGNGGRSNFNMLIGNFHSAYGSGSVFGATYGGKSLLGGAGLINARGTIPAKGTFTSTVAAGAKFTGSWNCHGFVWRQP